MGKDYRIIIAGGRKFNDYDKMVAAIDSWKNEKRFKEDDKVTVVCGCAEGADDLGRRYAQEHNWEVAEFPANWDLLGKAAGILRNKEMAKFASESESKDGMLFAFWNGKSKGTKNMIDTAIQHELPVFIFSYQDPKYNTDEIMREYIGSINGELKEIVTSLYKSAGAFSNIVSNIPKIKSSTPKYEGEPIKDKDVKIEVKNI